jgi:hypothetical protein
MHLAYPDIGFALLPLASLMALFSQRSWNAHKRLLGHASERPSGLREHSKDGLHEKATPTFIADLSPPLIL